MTPHAEVPPTPADQRCPREAGEDALALMLGQLAVSMALVEFQSRYEAGDDARTAMQAALRAAQGAAAMKWKRIMDGYLPPPQADDLAVAQSRRLGALQGRSILLAAKLRGALVLLRSGKPDDLAAGIAEVEAAAADAEAAAR